MSIVLTKDAILNSQDIETGVVEVPEWGGSVRLKVLTGAQRDEWEQEAQGRRRGEGKNAKMDTRGLKASLLYRCIVDVEGDQMFGKEDLSLLNSKSSRALERVWDKAVEMNGIGDDEVAELEKNSEGSPSDSSGSD